MAQDQAASSFRVHLEPLTRFATQLDHQLGAMDRPAAALAALSQRPLPLGLFAEGDALGRQHHAATVQLMQLTQAIRDALVFTAEVTRTVATQYQRFDEAVADGYRSVTGG